MQSAETALDHSSGEEASKEWNKRLGDRFPIYKDPSNKAIKITSGGIPAIKTNTGSA